MVERTQLETERLILRPLRLADLDDVLEYAADEEWSRFLGGIPFPYSGRDGEEYLARSILNSWDLSPQFGLEFEARLVGSVSVRIQPQHRTAELGYAIARRVWGQGLAVEAVSAVISWSFEKLDLVKVYAAADSRNERSIRVMQKLGLKQEGLLRQNRIVRGAQIDEVRYAVLKEEWIASKPAGSS